MASIKAGQAAVKHSNRLKNEASPYLLQHANNPVDWYPWGDEAFDKAREENKPIFLSIGYSTCHWCHVMAHESFENEKIAAVMNEHFVCIKVDREEHPGVDSIYMDAVQAMTGSGGWPLSVFLTPDGKPFYGGTYFPPEDKWGRPGFTKILLAISDAWENKRTELIDSATKLTEAISQQQKTVKTQLSSAVIGKAVEYLKQTHDPVEGGFGSAPKFPSPSNLSFLLWNYYRTDDKKNLEMVTKTLDKMAAGGMYDHLGGGFHRYSTDAKWLVPHFEKMLYDQGLLARSYLQAYQITGHVRYGNTVREIFDYVLRDMTDAGGGFYSAEDADSEGEEGVFYVWKEKEIVKAIGVENAKIFNAYYGVSKAGNFEHSTNILNVAKSVDDVAKQFGIGAGKVESVLKEAEIKLLQLRSTRIRPSRDEKIITGWNGLMISAMATGGKVLGEGKYTRAAEKAADFVTHNLHKNKRLMRYWGKSKANESAVLNDYAFLINGLVDLYEATYDAKWLGEAVQLVAEMQKLFSDTSSGGFYLTGSDSERLIVRKKPSYDGAIPSGNSVAAMALLRLGHITMDTPMIDAGENTLKAFSSDMDRFPAGLVEMLMSLDYYLGPRQEIVLAGKRDDETMVKLISLLQSRFLPTTVVILHETGKAGEDIEGLVGFVKNQVEIDGKTTAYLCENFVCKRPVTDYDTVKGMIDVISVDREN